MTEDREKDNLEQIKQSIERLPEELQDATWWMVTHLQWVESLCKNPGMTMEEIKKHQEKAMKKRDHLQFVLLCAILYYQESENQTVEQAPPQEQERK